MANSRGYRVPTRDDDPDVPTWNDRLAQDVAKDIDALADLTAKPQGDQDVIFAITDEDGRRTWLEVAPDGKPTPRAADIITSKVSGPVSAAAQASVGVQDQTTATTGLSFAVVDEDGRRTDLELDPAGRLTDRVVDGLRLRITGTGAVSPMVICSGDSMTAGASGTPYPSHLVNLTNWNVQNVGVGGETSTTIAGRVGGRPMMATVAGGSIPASGGVTVTLASEDGLASPTPLKQQAAGVNPVRIAGVEGTLSLASNVYTFTRSTAGSSVALNVPVPVITQAMRDLRSGIAVMWWGTNDATADMTDVIARQQAYLEHLTDLRVRYLVIGLTISSGAYRAPSVPQFRRAYGRRFIDLAAYMSSTAALQDAGMTPTQADLDAIATGNMPPQLLADPTHFNDAGNLLVAKQVRNRIQEMGWL